MVKGASGTVDTEGGTAEGSITRGRNEETPLLVRAVWFLFVGWWLTGIWLAISWLFLVTIIGAPVGILMINRVPFVLSLKRREFETQVVTENGETEITTTTPEQSSLLLRTVYFLLVGWWLSLLWMTVAYAFTVSILGLPIAIWMFGKLPYVVSLYRY